VGISPDHRDRTEASATWYQKRVALRLTWGARELHYLPSRPWRSAPASMQPNISARYRLRTLLIFPFPGDLSRLKHGDGQVRTAITTTRRVRWLCADLRKLSFWAWD